VNLKAEGKSNREVAREVGVGETTVRRVTAPKNAEREPAHPAAPPPEKPAWARELDEMERPDVQAWHSALAALRTINAQRPVPALFAHQYTRIDHAIAKEIDRAADWINEFREMFHGPDTQRRRA
jgi:hypothetical protein